MLALSRAFKFSAKDITLYVLAFWLYFLEYFKLGFSQEPCNKPWGALRKEFEHKIHQVSVDAHDNSGFSSPYTAQHLAYRFVRVGADFIKQSGILFACPLIFHNVCLDKAGKHAGYVNSALTGKGSGVSFRCRLGGGIRAHSPKGA